MDGSYWIGAIGWGLLDGRSHRVHHTQPALPMQLPTAEAAQESKTDDSNEDGEEYDEDTERR